MQNTRSDLTVISLNEKGVLTFNEICEVCDVKSEIVIKLVEFGVVEPKGEVPEHWHFSLYELDRLKRARRLQHDLNVHIEAVGLVLDLVDELNLLRTKVARLEHFDKMQQHS